MQTRRVYDGTLFQVDVLSWTDGQGRALRREVVRHPGAVTVIAITEDDRVLMIHNRRIAVDERLCELPAGKLEPGEPPEAAAARELAEETGCRAARVRRLGAFYTSPGFADELMHVFVAEGLAPGPQRLEPGEDIDVQPVALTAALDMIRRGEIRDGKSIAALLMYWTFVRNGPE